MSGAFGLGASGSSPPSRAEQPRTTLAYTSDSPFIVRSPVLAAALIILGHQRVHTRGPAITFVRSPKLVKDFDYLQAWIERLKQEQGSPE